MNDSISTQEIVQQQTQLARRIRNVSLIAAAIVTPAFAVLGSGAQLVFVTPALTLAVGGAVLLAGAAMKALRHGKVVLTVGEIERMSRPLSYWAVVAGMLMMSLGMVALVLWFALIEVRMGAR